MYVQLLRGYMNAAFGSVRIYPDPSSPYKNSLMQSAASQKISTKHAVSPHRISISFMQEAASQRTNVGTLAPLKPRVEVKLSYSTSIDNVDRGVAQLATGFTTNTIALRGPNFRLLKTYQ